MLPPEIRVALATRGLAVPDLCYAVPVLHGRHVMSWRT